MNVVVTVSGYIIPAVMLFIVIHGMIKKVNVYDEFVTGAKDGMKDRKSTRLNSSHSH